MWNAQSDAVKEGVDARDKLWAGGQIREKFMGPHPAFPALEEEALAMDHQMTLHLRHLAKPVPYAMTLTKSVPVPE